MVGYSTLHPVKRPMRSGLGMSEMAWYLHALSVGGSRFPLWNG